MTSVCERMMQQLLAVALIAAATMNSETRSSYEILMHLSASPS